MDRYGIVRCNHCKDAIEYTQEDLELGGDHLGLEEIFITCPECGGHITISVMPSLIAMMNMDNGTGGEAW